MGTGWMDALNIVAPGVGWALKANERSKHELDNYGIGTPTSQFAPDQIDPSLQQGKKDTAPHNTDARDYRPASHQSAQQWNNNAQVQQNATAGSYSPADLAKDKQQTTTPEGWDYSGQGVAEQYWDKNQDRLTGPSQTTQAYEDRKDSFSKPGQGEQYWNQVNGKFNQPTNSQGAYDRAAKQNADPGLGAYYDRAKQNTANSLNNQLAAMGLQGSSVGGYQMGQALSGLDAERANREADFQLRQNQALSQMAGSADSQNQNLWGQGGQMANAAQQLGLTRDTYGINAAQAADSSETSRFNAGMSAAQAAQDARRTRGQDMYSNVYGPAAQMSEQVGQAQNDMLAQDAQYMDAAMAAELGLLNDAVGHSQNEADRQKTDENHGLNAMGQIVGMAGGMGGGGGMGAAAGGAKK